MKLKYYLRGLGTGILFATLIMFISYSYNYSNAKIKEKAKELGMVEASETVKGEGQTTKKVSENTTKENTEEETTTQEMTTKEKLTVENETTSSKEETTREVVTTNQETTVTETTKTTEQTTKEKETTTANAENKEVEFTISGGMNSQTVAAMLAQSGVIDDAEKFDQYLVQNGYSERISVGTYSIKGNPSYIDIALLITN